MEVHDIIKDIKGKFRLFMNGVISQSMRDKGMDYKLIFGIEVPRLKEIASQYEKNTIWHRHYGKKTSANARFWRPCFSRLIHSTQI